MAVPRPHTETDGSAPVSRDAPIGIFDSGFGGLTVARAVLDQLPHESISYFGDTARQPYGPRPIAQVRAYALECLDQLVDSGIKMLVIACNSASGAVLRDARERYDIPVVEVIRPAVRLAVAATRNQHVGVISTRSTRRSMAYDDAFAAAPHIRLTSQECPRFVEFVEAGVTGGDELLRAAHEYLDPVAAAGVDTLILGCTHYPLLTGVISYVMGEDVVLINSADETAKDVYRILAENSMMRPYDLTEPVHCFTTTGDPDQFREIGQRFLGPEIGDVSHTLPDMSAAATATAHAPSPASPEAEYV
jgi:glutamate racemase